MLKVLVLSNTKKVAMLVRINLIIRENFIVFVFLFLLEEALHALDRYRLYGRELEVEFARGDRKSMLFYLI